MLSIILVIVLGAGDVRIEREADLYAAPRVNECLWIDIDKAIEQSALETDLQVEVRRRLRALDYLPDLFQRQLDEIKNMQAVEIETAQASERTNCAIDKMAVRLECDEISFYQNWDILIPIAGTIVLLIGMAAGYGVAQTAR